MDHPSLLKHFQDMPDPRIDRRYELIDIFFKTPGQHLKLKTFTGTSENALPIQIWTVLIALLLLKYLHHLSKFPWSMSNLATMLRLNLFTYRDLARWLHDPFGEPPSTPA